MRQVLFRNCKCTLLQSVSNLQFMKRPMLKWWFAIATCLLLAYQKTSSKWKICISSSEIKFNPLLHHWNKYELLHGIRRPYLYGERQKSRGIEIMVQQILPVIRKQYFNTISAYAIQYRILNSICSGISCTMDKSFEGREYCCSKLFQYKMIAFNCLLIKIN